ncbi:hypothetical protein D9758_008066 [Tetrapyrgos nigripes]|uniref:Uncharacterized protein n=1 Tax=Tetrapyrgos nigripes TaxID=182062 RepID=A0A8H5D1E2_9AGAR|nr:hypothetical protein D9758_008066 [Tetrapyrgos nigripes]
MVSLIPYMQRIHPFPSFAASRASQSPSYTLSQKHASAPTTSNPNMTLYSDFSSNSFSNSDTNPTLDDCSNYYEYGHGGYTDGCDDGPPSKRVKMTIVAPRRSKSRRVQPTSLAPRTRTNSEIGSGPGTGAGVGITKTESVQSVEMLSEVEDAPLCLQAENTTGVMDMTGMDITLSDNVVPVPSSSFSAVPSSSQISQLPHPALHLALHLASLPLQFPSSRLTPPQNILSIPASGSFHLFKITEAIEPTFSNYEKLYHTLCASISTTTTTTSSTHGSAFSASSSSSSYRCLCNHSLFGSMLHPSSGHRYDPSASLGNMGSIGLIQSPAIRDPLDNKMLDVALVNIRMQAEAMTTAETGTTNSTSTVTRPPPGLATSRRSPEKVPTADFETTMTILSHVRLIGEGCIGDIVDAFGEFVLRPIWSSRSGPDSGSGLGKYGHRHALFRGRLSLKIFYGEIYAERGVIVQDKDGNDLGDYEMEFWAVMVGSGSGLDAGDGGCDALVQRPGHGVGLSRKDVEKAIQRARKRGAMIPS